MNKNTEDKKIKRHPVVVVMGHIDHGKSTLLDYIRKSDVVAGEAGGITQHLGAYETTHTNKNGEKIKMTFIDTPGHAAFSSVRVSGARAADIAILIVSAEDGVKPQTVEAIETIKKNNVPFVVAINKIDSPKANIERTKQSLAEKDIFVEGYGGDISAVSISAKTGEGVDELLEIISLLADMNEYYGDESTEPYGFIVETNKDNRKGTGATIVIKNGTLKQGDCIVSGSSWVTVRIMEDEKGKPIKEATFSKPIRIYGWSDLPEVGNTFLFCANKKEAEIFVEEFKTRNKKKEIVYVESEDLAIVPIIIKADSVGSMKAIEQELEKVRTEKVIPKIILSSTGDINESDIKLASGKTGTVVFGFGVKVDPKCTALAERLGIHIKTYKIIYDLIDYVKILVDERTPRKLMEEIKGKVKILKTFSATKNKQIIGGRVVEGVANVGDKVTVTRRNEPIGFGYIRELQKAKVKTGEVKEGDEFGLAVESKTEIAPGDILEVITMVTK